MIYPSCLYLSRFHLSHHSFRQSIYSVRIVLLVEAGAEEGGEGLVEAGTDRTQEGLDKVIGRRVALLCIMPDIQYISWYMFIQQLEFTRDKK